MVPLVAVVVVVVVMMTEGSLILEVVGHTMLHKPHPLVVVAPAVEVAMGMTTIQIKSLANLKTERVCLTMFHMQKRLRTRKMMGN